MLAFNATSKMSGGCGAPGGREYNYRALRTNEAEWRETDRRDKGRS